MNNGSLSITKLGVRKRFRILQRNHQKGLNYTQWFIREDTKILHKQASSKNIMGKETMTCIAIKVNSIRHILVKIERHHPKYSYGSTYYLS